MNVLIRCDGSAAIGMGHVTRCLALADELRDAHRCAVTFAMRDAASPGVTAVRAAGYASADVPADDGDGSALHVRAQTASRAARALVVDVRDGLSRASLESIRQRGVLVVTIDDTSARRLASDLVFCPPVPQFEELDWNGFTGQRFVGWDWVILRREFAVGGSHEVGADPSTLVLSQSRDERSEQASMPQGGASSAATAPIDVLVTMGGGDPAGMTEFVLRSLELLPMPLAVRVVVGPAFERAEELIDAVARSKHAVSVSGRPPSVAPLMRATRIAVASFGVTAYELAACGVPAAHLCLTDDHARSSSAFAREDIAITIGVFGRVMPQHVSDAVSRLIGNAGRRTEMAARARRLIDGRGARRVAAEIVRRLRR